MTREAGRTRGSDLWDPNFATRSPIFADLSRLLPDQRRPQWPDCRMLQGLLPAGTRTHSGHRVRFAPQDSTLPHRTLGYEERIHRTGLVSTRDGNWHDYFNALIWCLFPAAKASLNHAHFAEIAIQPDTRRTRRRDALTLFDECGIVLAFECPLMVRLIAEHRWMEAFWIHRSRWRTRIQAFVFGHALYAKALSPYIGMTGNAVAVAVDNRFFGQPLAMRYAQLNARIADVIATGGSLADPSGLLPLPVLGIPGWHAGAVGPGFYANRDYFRPLRRPA